MQNRRYKIDNRPTARPLPMLLGFMGAGSILTGTIFAFRAVERPPITGITPHAQPLNTCSEPELPP